MNLVTDASTILSVAGDEPEKRRIIELTVGDNLIAPESVPWEIGNAISSWFRRGIPLDTGLKVYQSYLRIPIRFVTIDLFRAIQIAENLKIYAYDAYLIECALEHHCPLITLDKPLIHFAETMGVKTIKVEK
ncbi:MAG: type II toxin-antitoxin system VapC family toxin [Anaerolineaceae bacterium]|nr:type II toxin-antitoxin system VapC family toxin [Anaerolineaceae bacterium]